MAKRGRRSYYLVFAHFPYRCLLSVCLSTIPAALALLVFAGLESLLSIDHWLLPTTLGAAWTRRVTHLCQGHVSFAMRCLFFAFTLLESANRLQKRIAPCTAGVETSCREVR